MADQHAAADQRGELCKDDNIGRQAAAAHGPVIGCLGFSAEVKCDAEADQHYNSGTDEDKRKSSGRNGHGRVSSSFSFLSIQATDSEIISVPL